MSGRTSPPFRADYVGSLLRPPRLLAAREDFAAGRIAAGDLRAVEDQEIQGAIKMQEDLGLRSATDGEFRRAGRGCTRSRAYEPGLQKCCHVLDRPRRCRQRA
jgi:hypothetical protein